MKKKYAYSFFTAVSVIFFLTVFQNCSDVHFDEADDLAAVKLGAAHLNTYSFDPNRSEFRPKINLTTIIDNSQSMQLIQNQMGEAFEGVADKLNGFSGSAQVYTTTQDLQGEKPSFKSVNFLNYVDENQKSQKVLYENSTQIQDLVPIGTNYTLSEEYLISSPFHIGNLDLNFNSQMNDEDFLSFKSNFNQSVKSIGVSGSNKEQPLCTLLKSIQTNVKPGEYQAFIIATNEDDQTDLESCPLKKEYKYKKELATSNTPGGYQFETCSSGNDCQYEYQASYNTRKKKRISMRRRTYYEKSYFKLKKSGSKDKYNGTWNTHSLSAKYNLKQHVSSLQFLKKVRTYVDGIAQYNDFTQSLELPENTNGYCDGTNSLSDDVTANRACNQSEINYLNSQLGSNETLVENTCQYTCFNQSSSDFEVSISQREFDTCESQNFTDGNNDLCAQYTSSLNDPLSSMVENTCQVICSNKSESKTVYQNRSSCDGYIINQDCSSDEVDNIISLVPHLLTTDQKDLVSCQHKECNDNPVTDSSLTLNYSSFDANNQMVARWPGFESDLNNSSVVAGDVRPCNDTDKAKILNNSNYKYKGWNISDFQTCTVKAQQSNEYTVTQAFYDNNPNSTNSINKQSTFHYFIDESSAEEASNEWTSCTSNELNRIQSNSLTNFKYMVPGTCNYIIEDVSPLNSCVISNVSGDQGCEPGSGFINSCNQAYSQFDLNLSTCSKASEGYKYTQLPDIITDSVQLNYKGSEKVSEILPNSISLGNENVDPVIQTVKQSLEQVNSGYFLASFINIPGDANCAPGGINPYGVRHQNLVDTLGDRAKSFSNCETDYSPALEFVFDLIVRDVEKSYVINMNPETDRLYSIVFYFFDGGSQVVSKNDYELSENAIVTFKSAELFENVKSVEVNVIQPNATSTSKQ